MRTRNILSRSVVRKYALRALVAGAALAAVPAALPAPAMADNPPVCQYCVSVGFADPVTASETYFQGNTQVIKHYTLYPTVTITGVDNDPATPGSVCSVTGTRGAGFAACEPGTYKLTYTVSGLGTFHSQRPITMNFSYVAYSGPGMYGIRNKIGMADGTYPSSDTITIFPKPPAPTTPPVPS